MATRHRCVSHLVVCALAVCLLTPAPAPAGAVPAAIQTTGPGPYPPAGTRTAFDSPTTRSLDSVAVLPNGEVWAAAYDLIFRWNGSVWDVFVPLGGDPELQGIHMLSPNEGWAVGGNCNTEVLWSTQRTPSATTPWPIPSPHSRHCRARSVRQSQSPWWAACGCSGAGQRPRIRWTCMTQRQTLGALARRLPTRADCTPLQSIHSPSGCSWRVGTRRPRRRGTWRCLNRGSRAGNEDATCCSDRYWIVI